MNLETKTIQAGDKILTDTRLGKGWVWSDLELCTDWDAAEFRITGNEELLIPDLAVNVSVTGRVIRRDVPNMLGQPVVRVRITFVGDDEPDYTCGGWKLATNL